MTIDELLKAKDVRRFAKVIVMLALDRDPVDALNDIDLARDVLLEQYKIRYGVDFNNRGG